MPTENHQGTELTKNQSLVLSALSDAEGPLSAYTILDQLRGAGFRAPLQVYRALDKLVEIGVVHRLESLNAFVACSQPTCATHETVVFTICNTCATVDEIADGKIAHHLHRLASEQSFGLIKSTVELRGLCASCQNQH